MSLLLNGTSGISGVDGTAATPALQGTDANTGVSFGTDTVTINTGGTARVTTDASGNVGIGVTPSAWGTGSSTRAIELGAGSLWSFSTTTLLVNQNAYFDGTNYVYKTTAQASRYAQTGGEHQWFNAPSGTAGNTVSFTRAMTLDASGNLLVGTTSVGGVGFTFARSATEPYWQLTTNTATNINNFYLFNQNATYNGYRFYVKLDGGVVNYSGNNVNLSDERTKTNIVLAGNYLAKICAIPVKLFNYKDEADGEQRTLGVIAQDVEAVAPEFVNNDGWEGSDPEDGVPLKTIYTTDLMFGLMKAIQELTARLEVLENK